MAAIFRSFEESMMSRTRNKTRPGRKGELTGQLAIYSGFTFAIFLLLVSCSSLSIRISDSCEAGRRVPDGEIPTASDLAQDAYCAQKVIDAFAPDGVITIFGSARAKEDWPSYRLTREFAVLWTKEMGSRIPILTGGGPGIMEAGNRGAKEAGGVSLGFSTYFGSGAERMNAFTTGGYMFASFSQREAEMVDRAVAVVIAQGGVGTEWEIFETISKIQTRKRKNCPVVLLGSRADWQSLFDRIAFLESIRTVSAGDRNLLTVASTPQEAVFIIKKYISERGL